MSASHRRPPRLFPIPSRRDAIASESPLRDLLMQLLRGEDLSRAQSGLLLGELLEEKTSDAEIGAVLAALSIKGETVDELTGLAEAMRARSRHLHCRHERFIDTAGTGSSQAKTFNVSTAAAFVCAGAGLPVAKHGSRAATSRSGSADVLSELGIDVQMDAAASERALNQIGICFLFAPLYHRATARVAALRRQLGLHTTFNLLGPLTNPAGAPRQLLGVWHQALLNPVAHTLAALGSEKAWIVSGADGLDEITTSGLTLVAEVTQQEVRCFTIQPSDFGLPVCANLAELSGGSPRENAQLIRAIFSGERDARTSMARDLVVANAAAALFVGGQEQDLRSAAERARASLESGAALEKLEVLSSLR